eukprot:1991033-Pleurochrysis_carterae.AAC.1
MSCSRRSLDRAGQEGAASPLFCTCARCPRARCGRAGRAMRPLTHACPNRARRRSEADAKERHSCAHAHCSARTP